MIEMGASPRWMREILRRTAAVWKEDKPGVGEGPLQSKCWLYGWSYKLYDQYINTNNLTSRSFMQKPAEIGDSERMFKTEDTRYEVLSPCLDRLFTSGTICI